jgi:hypothetical protein
LELEENFETQGYCRFLRYEVGIGEHIHLWLDWWHPMGVLFEKFGFKVVYDAHSTLEAKLSSVI